MGISAFAENQSEKVAYVMAQGQRQVTYGELEAAANQGAQLFRDLGLKRGDHIAILLENHPLFFQIVCPALSCANDLKKQRMIFQQYRNVVAPL